MATILSNLNRFTFFSSEDSLANLQTIQPLLAHVAALPCETLMSEKEQAIYDKLQGGLATYLRRGEVFNNQIKKGLLLSRRIYGKVTSNNVVVSCTSSNSSVLAKPHEFVHSLFWPTLYMNTV